MPLYIHRTTFQRFPSTSPASLQEPEANYVQDPDESAIQGQPSKYWILTGDIFTLMDQAARDAVDEAQDIARKDNLADQIDTDALLRAVSITNLELFNQERLARGASEITPAQYKANVRGNL